jgi:hypothetical protein
MKAIRVRFRGPTNTRPASLWASDSDGNRVRVSCDTHNAHDAARALCAKLDWQGRLVGGGLGGSEQVFVFLPQAFERLERAALELVNAVTAGNVYKLTAREREAIGDVRASLEAIDKGGD